MINEHFEASNRINNDLVDLIICKFISSTDVFVDNEYLEHWLSFLFLFMFPQLFPQQLLDLLFTGNKITIL